MGRRRAAVSRHRSPYQLYGGVTAVLAAVATVVLVWWLGAPLLIAWLLGAGAVTFGLFAWDKQRARSDGGRVPERVLQGAVLLGGVLGGWAGMLLLRHKTRHVSFWVVQAAATVLWGAAGLWAAGALR